MSKRKTHAGLPGPEGERLIYVRPGLVFRALCGRKAVGAGPMVKDPTCRDCARASEKTKKGEGK